MKCPKRKKDKIKELVDEWQKNLNITDWKIKIIIHDTEGTDQIAEVSFTDSINLAKLEIYKNAWHDEWNEIKETIIHELIHIKQRRHMRMLEKYNQKLLDFIRENIVLEDEKFVEDLSQILGKMEDKKNDDEK